METETTIVPAEQKLLLEIARRSIADRASGLDETALSETRVESLTRPRGCFVTLRKEGELRGCIGHVVPKMPLCRAVGHNACAAAFNDPRFEPVSADEVPKLEIEISVLSDLEPVPNDDNLLSKLRPGIDGVLLRCGHRMSTFLPQVWEALPDKGQFLSRLCLKAGCSADAWKNPATEVSIYQVQSFSDPSQESM